MIVAARTRGEGEDGHLALLVKASQGMTVTALKTLD